MPKNKTKYTFKIRGINVESVKQKYFKKTDDSENNFENLSASMERTSISELGKDTMITYLGESKQVHKCNVSMIDFKSGKEVLMLKYHCFWCRFPFSNQPLGCPIKHVPSKIVTKYKSSLNQNEYIITEPDGSLSNSHYQTDGVFCSFNCCMSYINDNKKDPLYSNSVNLLNILYSDIYGSKITKINPAPHWRTLVQYGGWLNINQFRDSFEKMEYNEHGNIINISDLLSSTGVLYEKKLKF